MKRAGAAAVISLLLIGCGESAATTTSSVPAPTTTIVTTTTTAPPSTTTTIPTDAIEIRAALNGYLDALTAADGTTALDFVDSGTLDLMNDLLLLAAAPVSVEEMEFLDALLVVRLRHRFPAAELDGMDAADVFVAAIEQDLLIGSPGAGISFDQINVIDDEATGEVGGSPAMWFKLEGTEWKVALGRTFDEYSDVLSVQLEQAAYASAPDGATRSEALLALLTTVEGEPIDPALISGPSG